MPTGLWIGLATALGLTWLMVPYVLPSVGAEFGLHVTIAIACGMSGVVLGRMRSGLVRKGAVVLVLLLSLVIAVGWLYLTNIRPGDFDWFRGIVFGFGLVLPPVAISALCARWRSGPTWTFAQVTSLAILAAPLSSCAGLVLVLILRGP